jgi:hypothetical protein
VLVNARENECGFLAAWGEGFLCFGAVHIDTMDEFSNLSNNVTMCLAILGLRTKK